MRSIIILSSFRDKENPYIAFIKYQVIGALVTYGLNIYIQYTRHVSPFCDFHLICEIDNDLALNIAVMWNNRKGNFEVGFK